MPGFHHYKYHNHPWGDQMKSKMLLISGLLLLTAVCATTATTTTVEAEHGHVMTVVAGQSKLYNETLNPCQTEPPDHLGFNDLQYRLSGILHPTRLVSMNLNYKSLCIITAKPTMMALLSA
jgi:hypothetical protein